MSEERCDLCSRILDCCGNCGRHGTRAEQAAVEEAVSQHADGLIVHESLTWRPTVR